MGAGVTGVAGKACVSLRRSGHTRSAPGVALLTLESPAGCKSRVASVAMEETVQRT